MEVIANTTISEVAYRNGLSVAKNTRSSGSPIEIAERASEGGISCFENNPIRMTRAASDAG
jgi:hypothetical protein